MLRLAAVIWLMLGTTLAGMTLMVILAVPQLAAEAPRLLPIACVSAFFVAFLVSMVVAKKLGKPAHR